MNWFWRSAKSPLAEVSAALRRSRKPQMLHDLQVDAERIFAFAARGQKKV